MMPILTEIKGLVRGMRPEVPRLQVGPDWMMGVQWGSEMKK